MFTLREIFSAVSIFLYIIRAAIFIYALLSWLRPRFKLFYLLERFVKPFLLPFRRLSVWLMARMGRPVDFSCWMAIIALTIIDQLLWQLYALLRAIP